jgi:hypothetical protein
MRYGEPIHDAHDIWTRIKSKFEESKHISSLGGCPCVATEPYNNLCTYVLYCYRYVPVRCDESKKFV